LYTDTNVDFTDDLDDVTCLSLYVLYDVFIDVTYRHFND